MSRPGRTLASAVAERAGSLGLGADASLLGMLTIGAWGVWMAVQGGHSPSAWSPVGVFLILLLSLGLVAARPSVSSLPLSRRICLGSLALFVVWNYLSLLWADAPGDAWVGADKTLLYAVSFSIFFLWRWPARTALTFLGLYVLVVAATSGLWLAESASTSDLLRFFEDGRALGPIGYVNGSVALWMTGLWPATFLAASPRVPAPLRALFLGCGALFAQMAVLGQSRGWFAVVPVAIALHLLLSRQRLRALLALAIVGAAVAVVHRSLLNVFEQWESGAPIADDVRAATVSICLGCALAGVAGAAWAIADPSIRLSPVLHRRIGGAVTIAVVLGLAVAGATAARSVGDPKEWISDRWESFTCAYCPSDRQGSRFTSSLSNDRSREWRVAVQQFTDSPLIGAGSDNYIGSYLEARTDDLYEPKYPHSTPLRLLGQLGLIGTLLFVLAFAIAAWLAVRSRRASDPLSGGIVGAALMVSAYWFLHGSIDFFWELPALAAAAFGLLGLAASVDPAAREVVTDSPPPRRPVVWVALAAAVAVLVCAVAAPGLSAAYERAALETWRQDQAGAYARFDRAAALNPLSANPLLLKGAVALLADDDDVAEQSFRASIRREPRNWYGYLELALLAASRSDWDRAEAMITRARTLNPRDRVAAVAERVIRRRIVVTPASVNALFLKKERARFLQP